MKGYVLVEGHGEVEAVGNLIHRVSGALGFHAPWARPIRWKNIHRARGLQKGIEFIRAKADAGALLLLRDADDDCPKALAPVLARVIADAHPSCPTALVLFYPEYEVLFLPCLAQMAGRQLDGRPGLRHSTCWDGESWEARRGLKEWLSEHFESGRVYKPTIDQLPLTRLIELDTLGSAAVPSFGTLQRAIRFLAEHFGQSGIYPAPSEHRCSQL